VLHTVELPAPVASIVQIKVDGAILPTGSYAVYDQRTLIRTDGAAWPLCNDLNLMDTQAGTWSVTATVGTEIPELGRMAVGELTEQFARACLNDGCQLPSPVQALVRQGVSMTFLDPTQVFGDGKVGLYLCDLFISTVNPGGISARAQAIDVDGPRPRRLTWPP
jgi:hypothetical protein